MAIDWSYKTQEGRRNRDATRSRLKSEISKRFAEWRDKNPHANHAEMEAWFQQNALDPLTPWTSQPSDVTLQQYASANEEARRRNYLDRQFLEVEQRQKQDETLEKTATRMALARPDKITPEQFRANLMQRIPGLTADDVARFNQGWFDRVDRQEFNTKIELMQKNVERGTELNPELLAGILGVSDEYAKRVFPQYQKWYETHQVRENRKEWLDFLSQA